MSEKINIQLELETVLKAIENDEKGILVQIIKKLLMADYEGFSQINELGRQIASIDKKLSDYIITHQDLDLKDVIDLEDVVDLEDADES